MMDASTSSIWRTDEPGVDWVYWKMMKMQETHTIILRVDSRSLLETAKVRDLMKDRSISTEEFCIPRPMKTLVTSRC